jgi:hypothetical protein
MGLDDEDVGAAYRLAEPAADLTVRELDQVGVAEVHVEVFSDLLGEGQVGTSRVELETLSGDELHPGEA